jgi:asparagine synthase (glutamine-hydrolysing)
MCGITKPLQELSGVYRMPWPALVQENAKAVAGYYRKSRYIKYEATPHLDAAFLQELKSQDFYLNDILKNFYPGKARQIESLCHGVSYAERGQGAHGCATHPLLSQPVIELGLKIPTYQSFHDGYDRIFFRRAVSRLKNSKSLWRRIKGQTTGSVVKECASHIHEIRDLLLNGKLIASGMINRRWYEQEITKIQHGHSENLWPVLHLLTAELWFKQWRLN